jgi:hemerythrin superfamily protein
LARGANPATQTSFWSLIRGFSSDLSREHFEVSILEVSIFAIWTISCLERALEIFPSIFVKSSRMNKTGSENVPIDEMILQDHQDMLEHYEQYKITGDRKWYNQFVWELTRHSIGEEIVLYPLLESLGEQGKQLADEARADHRRVKDLLSRTESLSSTGPDKEFDTSFANLYNEVQKHMQQEEKVNIQKIPRYLPGKSHQCLLSSPHLFIRIFFKVFFFTSQSRTCRWTSRCCASTCP